MRDTMTRSGPDAGDDSIRPGLAAAIDRCWDELSQPGTWWDAAAKGAIAEVARAAIVRHDTPQEPADLPASARDAATRIAATPADPDEAWVRGVCDAIGETRYVELTGIVARVVAVDTFQRLLGRDVIPLPEPRPGEPTHETPPKGARRNRTWVRW